ncbi:hypothetical protein GJ744_001556 [Endocarpon pusillum]|uniref:Uncharacterized protein n=1 Tax=Endocarpon pusillum TaxID=364733 RepID=A0A8H7A9A2_9EURO|nr:hypothetical protein GJ744_001556 [Endocarpon pusillum]
MSPPWKRLPIKILHIHETQALTHQQSPVGQTYSRVHLNSNPSAEGMQRAAQSSNDPRASWKDTSPIPAPPDPSIALEISSSNTPLPDPTEVRRLAERMSNISIVDITFQNVGRNATIDNEMAFNPTGSTSFAVLGSRTSSATGVPPISSGAQHNSGDFGMSAYSKPAISSSHSNWPSSQARRSNHRGFLDVTMPEEAGLSQEIGFQGEYLLYKILEQELRPHFTSDHWISNNRDRVFDNHFGNGQMEKYYADFTYRDDDGKLGKYIAQRNGEIGVNPIN